LYIAVHPPDVGGGVVGGGVLGGGVDGGGAPPQLFVAPPVPMPPFQAALVTVTCCRSWEAPMRVGFRYFSVRYRKRPGDLSGGFGIGAQRCDRKPCCALTDAGSSCLDTRLKLPRHWNGRQSGKTGTLGGMATLQQRLRAFLSSPQGKRMITKGQRQLAKPENQRRLRQLINRFRSRR
jgi:hypothetical protein